MCVLLWCNFRRALLGDRKMLQLLVLLVAPPLTQSFCPSPVQGRFLSARISAAPPELPVGRALIQFCLERWSQDIQGKNRSSI